MVTDVSILAAVRRRAQVRRKRECFAVLGSALLCIACSRETGEAHPTHDAASEQVEACYERCRSAPPDACAPSHEACVVLCGPAGGDLSGIPPYLTRPILIEAIPKPSTVVEACTPLPITYRETFTTAVDDQSTYSIGLLFGSQRLGEYTLSIPPAPAGVPQLRLTITAQLDGTIIVQCTEEKTGRSETAEFGPVAVIGGLPDPRRTGAAPPD